MSMPPGRRAEQRRRPVRGEATTPADSWGFLTPDPFEGGLRLIPMDSGSWRLCDADLPSDDAASLLAYIERDESGVSVVWLQGAFAGRHHFASLEDAIAAAGRAAASAAVPLRPFTIPSFAPRAG